MFHLSRSLRVADNLQIMVKELASTVNRWQVTLRELISADVLTPDLRAALKNCWEINEHQSILGERFRDRRLRQLSDLF